MAYLCLNGTSPVVFCHRKLFIRATKRELELERRHVLLRQPPAFFLLFSGFYIAQLHPKYLKKIIARTFKDTS